MEIAVNNVEQTPAKRIGSRKSNLVPLH